MGACTGLIKSVLKHIFRLWTDVRFVESHARWRLQAQPLEVIALTSLLAEPPQIFLSFSKVQMWSLPAQVVTAGGSPPPARTCLPGTAPGLLGTPMSFSQFAGSLCLGRSEEPCLAEEWGEHRGWVWVGTAGSRGSRPSKALLRWGRSRNLSCCQSREGPSVGQELWRVAGDGAVCGASAGPLWGHLLTALPVENTCPTCGTALGCSPTKVLAWAWAGAARFEEGVEKAVQPKQWSFSLAEAVKSLPNVLMCVQTKHDTMLTESGELLAALGWYYLSRQYWTFNVTAGSTVKNYHAFHVLSPICVRNYHIFSHDNSQVKCISLKTTFSHMQLWGHDTAAELVHFQPL